MKHVAGRQGQEEKYMGFNGNTEREWDDNIQAVFKKAAIRVAQDRDQWPPLANTLMKFWVLQDAGNLLAE
jgi:hypothetical protein